MGIVLINGYRAGTGIPVLYGIFRGFIGLLLYTLLLSGVVGGPLPS